MRAAIVGASVAGLVAARQLRLAGWNVAVYERSAGPNPSGYVMDFFGQNIPDGVDLVYRDRDLPAFNRSSPWQRHRRPF